MPKESYPFLFFGQGLAKSRKGLECLAWFVTLPDAVTRERLQHMLPDVMRHVCAWGEHTLHFGSDDALDADWGTLCAALEAWAIDAHAASPLIAFVKADAGRGRWDKWSRQVVRDRFSELALAAAPVNVETRMLAETLIVGAVAEEKDAQAMASEQRQSMWRWLSGFETPPKYGATDPLANRLVWLADRAKLTDAEIDRLMCDAGTIAVSAIGAERAFAACLARQQSADVGSLKQALQRIAAFARPFSEQWPEVTALLEALARNQLLEAEIEEAERTVYERSLRGEAPKLLSASLFCSGFAFNGMMHRRHDQALRWLQLSLRFSHPPPKAFIDLLVAARALGVSADMLALCERHPRFQENRAAIMKALST